MAKHVGIIDVNVTHRLLTTKTYLTLFCCTRIYAKCMSTAVPLNAVVEVYAKSLKTSVE